MDAMTKRVIEDSVKGGRGITETEAQETARARENAIRAIAPRRAGIKPIIESVIQRGLSVEEATAEFQRFMDTSPAERIDSMTGADITGNLLG